MRKRILGREELHAIGVRRRRDPDVKALLWEIKRLRDVASQAEAMARHLRSEEPVHRDYFLSRLEDLLEEERQRFELGSYRPPRLQGGKPERGPVNGYAQRRAQQVPEEELSDREAKRRAREQR